MALWMASPPTWSVRMPRASLTAMSLLGLFMPAQGDDAARGEEGERRAGEDRRRVRAERVIGRAGEPGPEQRADSGPRIEEADDAGHGARAVEVHDDGGQQRDGAAVAHAEADRERDEQPV